MPTIQKTYTTKPTLFNDTDRKEERNIANNNQVTSNNQFNYSRRVTQIGMNGRYLFARIQMDF